jgi:hypothetical protein
MLAQTDVTSLAPYLAGPGAAVVVLVLVLWGLYTLVVRHFMPLAAALGKRHLDQIDSLIANQKAESNAITKTLASIDRRLARLEGLTDAGSFTPNPGAQSPDRGS